jgi:hypothetical protein
LVHPATRHLTILSTRTKAGTGFGPDLSYRMKVMEAASQIKGSPVMGKTPWVAAGT